MGFITCKTLHPSLSYSGLKHPHSRYFCAQYIQLLSHQFPPMANAILIHLICFPDKKCHINEMWGFHGSKYQIYGHLACDTMPILQHIPLQWWYRFTTWYGITSQQHIITTWMLNQYDMFFKSNFVKSWLIQHKFPASLSIDQWNVHPERGKLWQRDVKKVNFMDPLCTLIPRKYIIIFSYNKHKCTLSRQRGYTVNLMLKKFTKHKL
jgi:hypothetical protein